MAGPSRLLLQNLQLGMFPASAPEQIPEGGAYEIVNGLLDEDNLVYRRGSTRWVATNGSEGRVRMLWSGYLKEATGVVTIIVTDAGTFFLQPTGEQLGAASLGLALGGYNEFNKLVAFQGRVVFPFGKTYDGKTTSELSGVHHKYHAVAGNRLLSGEKERVIFSEIPKTEGEAPSFVATNYHSMPHGVEILGMEGLRTSCVVFTTGGIYVIGSLNRELTDEEGNVQQTLDRYSADAVLWGNQGVAGFKGGLVVPCRDDVFLMNLGVSSERTPFTSISGPVQNIYRGYVASGYKPGQAAVYHGHYFLPILLGDEPVDMLVCRLDHKGFPWTKLKGSGGRLPVVATDAKESILLGAATQTPRLQNLTYFEQSLPEDADGEMIPFEITYRDVPTGNLVPNQVLKARLSYRLLAPESSGLRLSFGASPFSGGATWGGFEWGGSEWADPKGAFVALTPDAKTDAQALKPHSWRVGRKVRYARCKVSLIGPASNVSIRGLELFVRQDGRIV